MRIGLLGGSFNPPHEGHMHISLAAMKGLELDAVWWLVTPQNPLKAEQPEPMERRIDKCRQVAQHPRIIISDIERELGTRITYYTVKNSNNATPIRNSSGLAGWTMRYPCITGIIGKNCWPKFRPFI